MALAALFSLHTRLAAGRMNFRMRTISLLLLEMTTIQQRVGPEDGRKMVSSCCVCSICTAIPTLQDAGVGYDV